MWRLITYCEASAERRPIIFTSIDRVGLLRLIEEESAQVVNVLPAREYERERIPGSVNVPLKGLNDETTQFLSRSKPVVVY